MGNQQPNNGSLKYFQKMFNSIWLQWKYLTDIEGSTTIQKCIDAQVGYIQADGNGELPKFGDEDIVSSARIE